MRRFLIYSITLAVLMYIAVIYASRSLAILAIAGFLLMAAAYLYLIAVCFCTGFSLELPIGMVQQDLPAELQIRIDNRSILPVTKTRFLTVCKLPLEKGKEKLWIDGAIEACGKTVLKSRVTPAVSGAYHIYLKKVIIYDLTGIFCLTRRPKDEAGRLYVIPEPKELAVSVTEATRHFTKEAAGDGDTLQIRPFRDGDRIQSIHWKMSAKTNALMVREIHASAGCPVVLFLDFGGKKKGNGNFYEMALSISYSLTAAHCPHYAVWYSGGKQDVVRVRIEDEEGLYLYLLRLFEEKADKKERDLKLLYCEKYRSDFWVTDICVNQDCMVTVNGHLTENIKEVELVV